MNANKLATFERHESEARSYCRGFPALFSRAKGSLLYDDDGEAYIDFLCGAGALNYGHNNDVAKRAVDLGDLELRARERGARIHRLPDERGVRERQRIRGAAVFLQKGGP